MSNAPDPRTAADIAGYLQVRAALQRRGDKAGMAAVDAELTRLGYTRAEAKKPAVKERAARPVKTEKRG